MSGPASSNRELFLQRRLARFGFWGFVVLTFGLALRLGLGVYFGDIPAVEDIGGQSIASLALFAMWLLVRGDRHWGAAALAIVDVVTMNAVAVAFCVMAMHLPVVAHPTLVLLLALSFTFTLRATYVPSSVRQTTFVHLTAWGWLLMTAAYGAERMAAVDPTATDASLNGQLITASIWWAFNSGAAIAATSVIYGLRKEVRQAMQLGQYTLEAKLGEGGMGTVYQARHSLLRRPTAVKLLPPSRSDDKMIARFEREVQRTAELAHPNVVTVFDYGHTPDGIFYYAMEHLDGLDLEVLVARHGPLPPGRALHVLVQICDGLAAAHEIGLIHRDIKPGNVLLCRGGRTADLVKIVDFGLLKEVGAAGDSELESVIVGTPACMPPEMIDGDRTVDERSDLYALGAVGYYLLAGHHVFEADNVVAVLAKHLHDAPTPIGRDDLPEGLEELVLHCLAKSPGDRPPSAAHLRDLFASLEDTCPWSLEDAQRWWARAPQEARDTVKGPRSMLSVDLASRE